MNDLELQQYLFDVQGYLVIENALGQEELAALNQLIDQARTAHTGKGSKIWQCTRRIRISRLGKTFL